MSRSFSPPALYNNFAENLRSLGFDTVLEGLQSAIRKEPAPSSGMYDDAAVFHDIVEKLADEGKEIILLPHSYGGVVANESAKGLLKIDREKVGKPGGVIQIVNITTVTPPVGETTYDQAADLGFDKVPIEGEYMVIGEEAMAKANYNDVSWAEAQELAKGHSNHSAKSFRDPLTYAAYVHVPVAWVFTEQDLTLPPDYQRKSIDLIEKESGNKVRVFNIDAGHCVTATRSKDLANLIKEIVSN
ncbi:hypothetical protein VI817_001759 [Penicillium citrinum]|nr:hypothetical protein VI817_001759 [Penicillium citrinum]